MLCELNKKISKSEQGESVFDLDKVFRIDTGLVTDANC